MGLDTIKADYFRLRGSGLDAKSVLTQLRSEIIGLGTSEREQLLEQLRVWEIGHAASGGGTRPERGAAASSPAAQPAGQPVSPPSSPQSDPTANAGGDPVIQPAARPSTPLKTPANSAANAAPNPAINAATKPPFAVGPAGAQPADGVKPPLPSEPQRKADAPPTVEVPRSEAVEPPDAPQTMRCPSCGKLNRKDDIFCYSCGRILATERGQFDTRTFAEGSEPAVESDEFFGPDSTLVLTVKGTQETFKVRPQDRQHEIIVGRGGGGAIKPDVDLASQEAITLGVSRMHLSIAYNERHHTLSASDMGSANGTFINGQRLHPEEVRVLRHGDEVRLGKLYLTIYFHRKPAPGTNAAT